MSEWEEFSAYRKMIRDAKAEAWDEGFTEGIGDGCSCDGCLKWVSNPYREVKHSSS